MRHLSSILEIFRHIFLIVFGIPLMGIFYFYEVYKSVAIMTFKGHKAKRIKASYYDHGYVRYTPEPDKNKRFENQILGAIVFIPVTFFSLLFLIAIISIYLKKWFSS